MVHRRIMALTVATLAAAAMFAGAAHAATVTASFSTATTTVIAPNSSQLGSLAGTAAFSYETSGVNAGQLTITLTNTQAVATTNGSELIGLFWNLSSGTFSGTLQSVTLGAGATIIPAGGDVGAFGYTTSATSSSQIIGSTGLSPYGVSAAGLGISYNTIKLLGSAGTNAASADMDGLDGGLVGTGGAGANIPSNKPVIKNSIVYTFSNVSGLTNDGSSITNLSNMQFFYGTAIAQPTPTPPMVPLPAAAWSGFAALSGLGIFSKLRRRRLMA